MKCFDFHTHNKDAENAVINLFDDEIPGNQNYYSIGLHPMDISTKNAEKAILQLKKTAGNKNIVAIGECGLDKNAHADIQTQKNVFIDHCKISEALQKPIIIHCVGYYDEIIKIIKQENVRQNTAVHAYNKKNVIILRKLIKAGFYVSLAWQAVTEREKLEMLLPEIPIDKLFLETDDNRELSIEYIYDIVSSQLNMHIGELNEIIKSNFEAFRFAPRKF